MEVNRNDTHIPDSCTLIGKSRSTCRRKILAGGVKLPPSENAARNLRSSRERCVYSSGGKSSNETRPQRIEEIPHTLFHVIKCIFQILSNYILYFMFLFTLLDSRVSGLNVFFLFCFSKEKQQRQQ